MDDANIYKTWERQWTTEEMRAHCTSWNLAGDVGLLKHLQEFSQNLLQKTHTAEVALDSLLEEMRNTSVDVQNASNALLMLSNNQFVENRVYDDCEEEKDELEVKLEEVKSVDIGEAALIAKAAETILLGMSVIDTKFDCMEVPASDSEGEEILDSPGREGRDKKSFALVLEPRNPYAARSLPYLIGSKEFMEDDKIGLGDDEDEEEEEDEDEEDMQVSLGQDLAAQGLANDSGSSLAADIAEEGLFDEDELNDRRMGKFPTKQQWESSSSNASEDIEVENNRIRKKPKKNEPFADSRERVQSFGEEKDIFGKESPSEDEFFGGSHIDVASTAPVKKQPVQKGFAEELAAKLGAVESKKADGETTKPKKKVESKTESSADPKIMSKTPSISTDYLFGPPKDEWNVDDDADSIFADTDGMFSSDRGLFDDLNDPLLDAKPPRHISAVPPSFSDKPPSLKKEKESSLFGGNDGNLFGDEDEDGADVFADILTKSKPSDKLKKSEDKVVPEAVPKNKSSVESSIIVPVSSNIESKGQKFVEASDSWLFGNDDQEEMYKEPDRPKERSEEQVVESKERRKNYTSQDVIQKEGKKNAAPRKKLPAGACSVYANGVDPFLLGKKVVKEVQEKKREAAENAIEDDDLFSAAKRTTKKVSVKAPNKPLKSEALEKASMREPKPSPGPESLFDDLDKEDDLFAPVTLKVPKGKNFQSNGVDNLFGDDLFASKKPAVAVSDKSGEKEKGSNARKISLGRGEANAKGLFGDSGSDDDDIFSCSSSIGSRSSGSKVATSKSAKPFSDPSGLFFGDEYSQEADIFSATIEKASSNEKKDVDDLFKDISEDDSHSDHDEKKEVILSEKKQNKAPLTESTKTNKDDLFASVDKLASPIPKVRGVSVDMFSEVTPPGPKMTTVSEDLFASDGEAAKDVFSSDVKSPLQKKIDVISDNFHDEEDVFSSSLKKEGLIDDILGEFDNKLDFNVNKKVIHAPEIISTEVSTVEAKRRKDMETKRDKKKVSENVFGDLRGSNGEDLFSNENSPKDTLARKPNLADKNPKPSTEKKHSKGLFGDFGNDNEDLSFVPWKGKEENKIDPLFNDPFGKDDDLFSSLTPAVSRKAVLLTDSEISPDIFLGQDTNETENLLKDAVKVESKEEIKKTADILFIDSRESNIQSTGLASNSRKSPPRTLNLGKAILFPKLGHSVSEAVGADDAEEDKIVQAWMKGHPPPLRDSKVESTMEDFSGYQDDYTATKTDIYTDDNSYFGAIPSGALLYSHGKERARIQSRRRPPSRKVRRTPAAVLSSDQHVEEEQVTSSEPPSTATPMSSASVEEDRGSQETVEEWSTPEAALVSPLSVPPRSNPLSPSTDEEQDFFDVLPVRCYPPPMAPPELSPFSDSLNPAAQDGVGDDLWDKEDSGLFEDAGEMLDKKDQHSLWASTLPPGFKGSVRDESVVSDDLFGDMGQNKVPKEPVGKAAVETKEKSGKGGLFVDVDKKHPSKETTVKKKEVVSKKTDGAAKEERAVKKEGKLVSSNEGDMDDLWGEGFTSGSKLEEDLFSKGIGSSRGGDIDDLFQGKGDLFRSSKTSSVQEHGKVNLGIAGGKSIGKSLSKLPPKTKDSLFDDDEDDGEDLFSPCPSKPDPGKASSAAKKVSVGKSGKEQKPKHSSVTVTSSKAASNDDLLFEDPLMVLKRKD